MANQWYFGSEYKRLGPFSTVQLRELAAQGRLQLTDTVWKEGIKEGALAGKVKNLFLAPRLQSLPANANDVPLARGTDLNPKNLAITNPNQTNSQQKPGRKVRAVVVRGAIIINQCGKVVQYRKKCVKCGYEDLGRATMPIRNGITRRHFFCPKCRKMGEAVIQGIT